MKAFHMFSPKRLSDKLPTPRMKWVLIGLGASSIAYLLRPRDGRRFDDFLDFVRRRGYRCTSPFLLDLASQRLLSCAEGGVLRAAGCAVKAWRSLFTKGASEGRFTISDRRVQASKALQEPTS